MHAFSLTDRSDAEVLTGVKKLAGREREATAWLVAHLAEIDTRKLYLEEGFSCVFHYCTKVLHLSEAAAHRRIHASRVARQFPIVFQMLHEGAIHLTTLSILGPCMTRENHRKLLEAARDLTKDKLLLLAASVAPKQDVPSTIRKLPSREVSLATSQGEPGNLDLLAFLPGSEAPRDVVPSEEVPSTSKIPAAGEASGLVPSTPAPVRKAVVAPLSSERYRVQFTASAQMTEKVRRLQDLLRHQIPNGDPAIIFERAIDMFLSHVERERFAKVNRPRNKSREDVAEGALREEPGESNSSRHIPARVKRAVLARDGGQCAFVAKSGQRCSERAWLEFHHVDPYGWGGPATVENIAMRCRAHNAYEGELIFGKVAHSR